MLRTKKIYRSNLTKNQRKDYDKLISKGVEITPFEYKNLIKSIKETNKVIRARKDQLIIKENLYTTKLGNVIRNFEDIAKLNKRLATKLMTRRQTASDINFMLRERLYTNLELLFGTTLGIEELSDNQLRKFLDDPLYKKFNGLLYAIYETEEQINNSKIGREIKELLYLTGKTIGIVINDVASYKEWKR